MASLCYVAHGDGVPNGYAENNRTKEVVRWKATGQHLSPEAKADLAAQAEQKRYARKQAERELYEATANRLAEEQQLNISGVDPTEYHKAKQIEVTPGAPVRRGCVGARLRCGGETVDGAVHQRGWDETVCERFAQTRMFPRRRCAEWRGGAAENSFVSGGGDRGRLRNSSHDREAGQSHGVSRLRLRQPSSGPHVPAPPLPTPTHLHRR